MTQKGIIGTITFEKPSQLALWQGELLGQISDGAWENSRPDHHWYFWHHLDPKVVSQENPTPEIKTIPLFERPKDDVYRHGAWVPEHITCVRNGYAVYKNLVTDMADPGQDPEKGPLIQRMLAKGRLGKALEKSEVLTREMVDVADHMPEDPRKFNEFRELEKFPSWANENYLKRIDHDQAQLFYTTTYDFKELKHDLIAIGKLMRTARIER